MSLNGIDISSWQSGIDISQIPCDFVICKATGGIGYINPDCDRAYQQAKSLGKKLGVYHFARESGYEGSAVSEADFFVDNIKGYIGEAILVLDFEGNAVNLGTGWALEFLNRVYERTSVRPLLYTYNNAVNSYNWSSVVNANYGLWNAGYYNYGTVFYDYNPNAPLIGGTGSWPGAVMYQYTSEGRLGNWNGNLDLNVFYGDTNTWDAYAKGDLEQEEEYVDLPPYDGTNIQLWDVNYNDAQYWWIRHNESEGSTSFRNIPNWKWLSVYQGASIHEKSNVCLWEGSTEDIEFDRDDPRAAQRFKLIRSENNPDAYNILYFDNQSYAVTVEDKCLSAGTNICMSAFIDDYSQQWYIYLVPNSDYYQIINAYSWKALDSVDGGF